MYLIYILPQHNFVLHIEDLIHLNTRSVRLLRLIWHIGVITCTQLPWHSSSISLRYSFKILLYKLITKLTQTTICVFIFYLTRLTFEVNLFNLLSAFRSFAYAFSITNTKHFTYDPNTYSRACILPYVHCKSKHDIYTTSTHELHS